MGEEQCSCPLNTFKNNKRHFVEEKEKKRKKGEML
jgi:hypothetical protein